MRSIVPTLVACLVPVVLTAQPGCSSTAIAIRESLGHPKREQLVDRVDETREAQEKAKDQFASTLDELRSLSGREPGELEAAYKRLRGELERSEDRAQRVRSRIDAVERVATALFEEWRAELDEYETESLRRASERQLDRTVASYEQVIGAMQRAESKMDPVLAAFSDQVLFLKHNLNARAIAALDETLVDLEREIEALIADMERSIEEADSFVRDMGAPDA